MTPKGHLFCNSSHDIGYDLTFSKLDPLKKKYSNMFCHLLTVLETQLSQTETIITQPINISFSYVLTTVFLLARGYPTLHLAMIFDDGLVYDFSVKDKCLQDVNLLMKLPKSKKYFGYSDENGVIYFIHSDATKSITKFHKSLNNKGHITLNKSKRPKATGKGFKFQYSHGVLLGNKFWLFGHFDEEEFYSDLSTQTTIWSTRKKVWIKGPDVITSDSQNSMYSKTIISYKSMEYTSSFDSVINSTTILLIGGDTVVCFNIVENRWTNYPNFPYYLLPNPTEMLATVVNIDKNGKRYAFPEKSVRFHVKTC